MTSATERLRALLDERGVEYRASATGYSIDIGPNMTAYANRTDTTLDVSLRGVTPEQAIDATLGRGTCHIDLVGYDEREDRFQCRSCDWSMSVRRGTWPRFNYCPNCGKAVVDG